MTDPSSRQRWPWPAPDLAREGGALGGGHQGAPAPGRALVFLPPGAPSLLASVVAEELNVDEVVVAEELGEVLRFELVPNFKVLAPAWEAKDCGGRWRRWTHRWLPRPSKRREHHRRGRRPRRGSRPGDLECGSRASPGSRVARRGEVVALTHGRRTLRRRGLAREVIARCRTAQGLGLDVSDRIVLTVAGLDELANTSS